MRSNGSRLNQSVSQTTLNLLRDCPRCFWLHVSAGASRPRQPWPTALRRLDELVRAYWDRYSRAGMLPPLLQGLLDGTPVSPRMEAWYDRVTGLNLVGRLDACIRTEQFLHVPVDHKCRGSRPVDLTDAYVLQLDTYELLLEKNGYPTAGFGYLGYYILGDNNLEMGIDVTVEIRRVDTDAQRALDWLLRARYVLDLDIPPEPSVDCEYCCWFSTVAGI